MNKYQIPSDAHFYVLSFVAPLRPQHHVHPTCFLFWLDFSFSFAAAVHMVLNVIERCCSSSEKPSTSNQPGCEKNEERGSAIERREWLDCYIGSLLFHFAKQNDKQRQNDQESLTFRSER